MINISNFTKNLLDDINKFQKIALFVHVTPDCDAIGSAYAMYHFLKLNFPKKQVKIAGMSKLNTSYLPEFFQVKYASVDEEFVNDSLGIVFDTANQDRIYAKQFFKCSKTYRIDHHIQVEKICDEELIDKDASSTCELLGLVIKQSNLNLNSDIVNSLYFGLLTDTIRFITSNVNANTYAVMTFIEKSGFLQRKLVHDQLYLKSIHDLKLEKKLFKYIKFKKDYAYMFFNKRLTDKYGMNNLKSKLFLMSGLKEVKIYFMVYYDSVTNIFKGSLRSRDYNVNLVAKKFNGGGHMYASGFKLNDKSELKLLKKEISKLLTKKDKYE